MTVMSNQAEAAAAGSQPRIRSYSARRGRLSPLTLDRLAALGPSRAIPDGPLDAMATFGRVAPLVLEIGCGHGGAAIGYAATHPHHDVLAVDVHPPGIARMLAAAQRCAVPNLRIVLDDGVNVLAERIAPQHLAGLHMFFPDPWPKARHHKRRLVGPDLLDLAYRRLAPSGVIRIATDHAGYASHIRSVLSAGDRFAVTEGERPAWRPMDGFEAKAKIAGPAVAEFTAVRR
ncbi:MAG: tRNA (guanosine(46)-N7)-methyltransferase TrmB [Nostocoides sp.]